MSLVFGTSGVILTIMLPRKAFSFKASIFQGFKERCNNTVQCQRLPKGITNNTVKEWQILHSSTKDHDVKYKCENMLADCR